MELSIQVMYVFIALVTFAVGTVSGYLISIATVRAKLARLQTQLENSRKSETDLTDTLHDKDKQNIDLEKQVASLLTKLESQVKEHEQKIELLETTKIRMSQEFENLANRIFDQKQTQFAAKSQLTIESSIGPLRRDIGEFRKQVENAYDKETADRNKLIGQISELQKHTMRVSEDAVSLANALRGDSKLQGNWGEFILEKLLEDSGLKRGREYNLQESKTDDQGRIKKPDVIVHLPEGKDIVIDAKVSLVAYESYFNSHDELEKTQYLRKHLNSLKTHIRGLSDKNYDQLEGLNSLDFVLLFVPIEAAFMLALDHAPEIMADAYERNIVLVSPSTLLVTLKTIKNLWRYDDQNRNSKIIAEKAGRLYDGFVRYIDALDEADKYLQRSKDVLGDARKRLLTGKGNLVIRAEELRSLGAKTKKQFKHEMVSNSEKLSEPEV